MSCQPNFINRKTSLRVDNREGFDGFELCLKEKEKDHSLFFNFSQNVFSKRDNPVIYQFFSVKHFFENYQIENMGRVYIKISMFKLKSEKSKHFSHNFDCFFLLEIYQNSITRYILKN